MRLGILETGRPPEELSHAYKSYALMIADWLAPLGGTPTIYPIMDGAPLPDPSAADLWAVTGSRCGVYEPHSWIPPLSQFIRSAYQNRTSKMIGICFGHQIMAQALGGNVVKSDKGWGVGQHAYEPRDWPAALGAPFTLRLNAYHQDQIVALPPKARAVASSDFCDIAAVHYPGFGFSVQGHPEFSNTYERDLVSLRRGSGLPIDRADKALDSLEQSPNADLLVTRLKNWQNL